MSLIKNIDTNTVSFIQITGLEKIIISPRTTWVPEPSLLPQILYVDMNNYTGHSVVAFSDNNSPEYIDAALDSSGHLIVLADSTVDNVDNFSIDSNGSLIYTF